MQFAHEKRGPSLIPSIPYDEFGGRGPNLLFAHANAYPPGCYRQLLERLAEDYHTMAIQHRPLWPDSRPEELDSWHDIADDMILFFEQKGLEGIIGVGHSLGAVATMIVAVKRPELFRAILLIEPVFLPPGILQFLVELPDSNKVNQLKHVRIAQRRRNRWATRQEAYDHFRPKRVFSRLSDDSLWDYVQSGLTLNDVGYLELSYRPAWEARIYTLPAKDVWELIPKITQPTLALRGAETDALLPPAWGLWQEIQPGAEFMEIERTGHLLPMEEPAVVADVIGRFIRDMEMSKG